MESLIVQSQIDSSIFHNMWQYSLVTISGNDIKVNNIVISCWVKNFKKNDHGNFTNYIGSLIVCVVFIFLPHSYRSKSCNPRSPKIFFERGVLN